VTVKDGQAVALRGDRAHPYTRGSLCNKVAGYLDYARSPQRILYPMRRVGPKGSGEFIRISWDEALATISPPVAVDPGGTQERRICRCH
jgi:anaerobic selenocysteine-containing dehydrogenase